MPCVSRYTDYTFTPCEVFQARLGPSRPAGMRAIANCSRMTVVGSRWRILGFVPRLSDHVARLCERSNRDFRGLERVLIISDALVCVTTDVILDCVFDVPSRLINGHDFQNQFATAIRDLQRSVHYLTAFLWLISLLNLVPEPWIEHAAPVLRSVFAFRRTLAQLILESKERVSSPERGGSDDRSQPIVFNEILQSDLSISELSTARLQDETLSIVGAGLESTRCAASVAIFHILDQPETHQRLKEELRTVVSKKGSLPDLTVLENLPWLEACVQEALRLAYGTVPRSPRRSPTSLVYGSHVIPADTPISCETYSMHHNERLYPNSWAYQPERWVNNPDIRLSADAAPTKLSRYMTAFGRGSRMCLGMHIAEAELYMVLAALFHQFDFELFETDRTAVDCVKTALGPLPKDGIPRENLMMRFHSRPRQPSKGTLSDRAMAIICCAALRDEFLLADKQRRCVYHRGLALSRDRPTSALRCYDRSTTLSDRIPCGRGSPSQQNRIENESLYSWAYSCQTRDSEMS
nr:trichodiene oxygenase [Quercus suber]